MICHQGQHPYHNANKLVTIAEQIQIKVQKLDKLNSKFVLSIFNEAHTTIGMNTKEGVVKEISGIGDRMVILVSIKIPGFKSYQLYAQIDIRAMSSCYKYKAIPAYYWQPTKVHFKVVNKQLMNISYGAPDFPIYISSTIVYVTLYNYDTRFDILLGQDFVKRHMPMIFNKHRITISVQNLKVYVPVKKRYSIRFSPNNVDTLTEAIEDLSKIKKIVKHVELHARSSQRYCM